MEVELVGFSGDFLVDVEIDVKKNIIHILDLAMESTSLINAFDINNNQDRVIKKFNLESSNEWIWILYSPWNNSVSQFEKGDFTKVNEKDIYLPFYNLISREKDLRHYITKLKIENLRHIDKIDILLSEDERKHLIITGRNGSGKTSLLHALKEYLYVIEQGKISNIKTWQSALESTIQKLNVAEKSDQNLDNLLKNKENFEKSINRYLKGVVPEFNTENNLTSEFKKGNFIIAFFDSKRSTKMIEPDAIKKLSSNVFHAIDSNPGNVFVQYLVNLKAEQAFASQEGDIETVNKITQWFEHLELNLQGLFESQSLKINFDFKSLNMYFTEDSKSKYSFNTLSDGFSSVINIVSDLILRMENKVQIETSYDVEGIVLIDEIETHLHVSLQKKILPFLTNLFPNIQFIISTHSPFVLSSVSNAIIYDLENKLRLDDLSGFSYEGIVESYFYTNQYGDELVRKLNRFELLLLKDNKEDEEKLELIELDAFFKKIPDELSQEAKLKYYSLINRFGRRNFK